MGLSDWDDALTRWLVRPPFRDAAGAKGWLTPFARAPAHQVRHLDLAVPGWPRLGRPLSVAFLADFHTGSHTDDVRRLEALVEEVAAQGPDLALYGGDFVNMIAFGGGRVPPAVIARILGKLPAPLGRFAVIGNHDRTYDAGAVTAALIAEGITVLDDAAETLSIDGTPVVIAGIPDARVERDSARALLSSLGSDTPALVLAHDPFWFGYLPAGPHVMLAGHTHGGQIRLPLIGPIRNASRAPLRWSYGLIEEDGRRMYVTSGLGCSGIPLRLNMPPEYVMLRVNGA